MSFFEESGGIIRKIKSTQSIPSNDISHEVGLKNILDKSKHQNISTVDLIKITEIVLRNNYFELNDKVKQ